MQTQAVITAMNWPIGFAVGNANEVVECIELLKGNGRAGPRRERRSSSASACSSSPAWRATAADAAARCRRALDSGQALERLRAIIERQGGNPRVIDDYGLMPHAPAEHVIEPDIDGFVTDLDAGLIGRAAVVLGGGRDKVDDEIDPAVGIMIPATVGDAVRAGDPVLRVQYRSKERLEDALPLLMEAVRVGESPRPLAPLIIDEVL